MIQLHYRYLVTISLVLKDKKLRYTSFGSRMISDLLKPVEVLVSVASSDPGSIPSKNMLATLKDQLERTKQTARDNCSICRDNFRLLASSHGIPIDSSHPVLISAYSDSERQFRISAISGTILATAVFGLLNVASFDRDPKLVFGVSVVLALLIGALLGSAVACSVRVDQAEPRSAAPAKRLHTWSGFTALAAVAAFLYMRFEDGEVARSYLAPISMIFEVATIFCVATARELLKLYSWPRRLTEEYNRLQAWLVEIQHRLQVCENELQRKDNKNDEISSTGPRSLPGVDRGPARPNGVAKPAGLSSGESSTD